MRTYGTKLFIAFLLAAWPVLLLAGSGVVITGKFILHGRPLPGYTNTFFLMTHSQYMNFMNKCLPGKNRAGFYPCAVQNNTKKSEVQSGMYKFDGVPSNVTYLIVCVTTGTAPYDQNWVLVENDLKVPSHSIAFDIDDRHSPHQDRQGLQE